MPENKKNIPLELVVDYCKKHPVISKLSIFGSALTNNLKKESDIDLLVEFEPNQTPSLFTIVAMEDEIGALIGRKADLRTAQDLSQHFRNEVISTARILYVKP